MLVLVVAVQGEVKVIHLASELKLTRELIVILLARVCLLFYT